MQGHRTERERLAEGERRSARSRGAQSRNEKGKKHRAGEGRRRNGRSGTWRQRHAPLCSYQERQPHRDRQAKRRQSVQAIWWYIIQVKERGSPLRWFCTTMLKGMEKILAQKARNGALILQIWESQKQWRCSGRQSLECVGASVQAPHNL